MTNRFRTGFCLLTLLWAGSSFAQCVTNVVTGTIVGTWTKEGSPYCIQQDVQVASLTIEPGVEVTFLGDYVFEVAGLLNAVGSVEEKIIFDIGIEATEWRGIRFDNSSPGSELAHVVVRNSTEGGIVIDSVASPPIIRDCEIVNNSRTGNGGGGIAITNSGAVTIGRCTISGNTSFNTGGGSNGFGGGVYADGILIVNDSVIADNAVQNGGTTGGTKFARGGGIYVDGELTLNRTRVERNLARFTGGNSSLQIRGGGVYVIGEAVLVNSVLNENQLSFSAAGPAGGGDYRGGGIYASQTIGSGVNIVNSTIRGHIRGGGIYTSTSGVTAVVNSIVWDNNDQEVIGGGANTVTYSTIQGLDLFPGTGNQNSNPIFLDTINDPELHLSFGSPAIDSGDCTAAPATDIDLENRPAGSGCDMGVDELSVTFADVAGDHWAHGSIEGLVRSGTTRGCGGDDFCPGAPTNRAQMAVFMIREIFGRGDYVPPQATGAVFGDVSADHWAAAFIEEFSRQGITSGCGGGNYCPDEGVTRAQMAVFLLRAIYGPDHVPPLGTGIFNDVPLDHWAVHWIEQLADEGITGGCGNDNFCPEDIITRDQMAVFLMRTFGFK